MLGSNKKLGTILSTFTKVQTDLEVFIDSTSQAKGVLKGKILEDEAKVLELNLEIVKAGEVLNNVRAILGG